MVESCRSHNRGWLRAPLGGNNGMQDYLWWANAKSRVVEQLKLAKGNIVVRAARHHDNHDPLEPGEPRDYLELKDGRDLTEDAAAEPLTEGQNDFSASSANVRLRAGRRRLTAGDKTGLAEITGRILPPEDRKRTRSGG